jgi:AcrR family transcriptional regulator
MERSLASVFDSGIVRLMPQVLKPELRERILGAALEVFAAHGYAGATMGAIAQRAGLGTASLYRYYPGKAELFAAAMPEELVERFESLLTRRVRALATSFDVTNASGEEILRFWIEHRLSVVILLDRAEGTSYAHFGEQFVTTLVRMTLEQIQATNPGVELDQPAHFVVRRIFENTRYMLASILEKHQNEHEIRQAIEMFWAYQIAGLRGLSEHIRKQSATSP